MVVHHLFGYPEWWISDVKYTDLSMAIVIVAKTYKMCVGMFAFLTG